MTCGYTGDVRRVFLLVCLAACPSPAEPGTPAPADPPAVATVAPLPDSPLMRLIHQAVSDCEIDNGGSFDKCVEQEGYRYFDEIGELEYEDLHAATALECRLLGDPNLELRHLALGRLLTTVHALKRGGQVSKVADDALLACLRAQLDAAVQPGEAFSLVRLYTEFSVGAGRDADVLEYLRGLSDPDLRRAGYTSLWHFAGMRVWPTLERIIEDGDDLTAASVLARVDDEVSDDERRALCAGYLRWLRDARSRVQLQGTAASHLAYRCPALHDELLVEVRANIGDPGQEEQVPAIARLAGECVEVGEETCKAAAALLEAIALAPAASARARDLALTSRWNQHREHGRALARRLRDDPNASVAQQAALLLGP